MKRKYLAFPAAVATLVCAFSSSSVAQAATTSWDYNANLSGSHSAKGVVDVARSFSTEGNGQASVKGLPVGNYDVVLNVSSKDIGNNATNSLTTTLCSFTVNKKNASTSCSNSSFTLPYGEGLFGNATVVNSSGKTVEEGSFTDNSSHAPVANGGKISATTVDVYGEHLGSTNRVYFQQNYVNNAPQINATFKVENNNWVHITAPTGLTYDASYNVTVVTPHGSVLASTFTPIPPAPVVTSVSPSPLSTAGGQTVTVKGSYVGTLYGRTPTPIEVDGVGISNYKIISDSEIQFTSPAHAAGSATLELICYGGNATYTIQYA